VKKENKPKYNPKFYQLIEYKQLEESCRKAREQWAKVEVELLKDYANYDN